MELSRQCAGVAAPEDEKEILADSSFSPPRSVKLSPTPGVTAITVPVEVHGPKTPPLHPSPVCRRGNTDVRIQPVPAPIEVKNDQIDVIENGLPISDGTGREEDTLTCLAERKDADSALLLKASKKSVKRKANVIESDDDDFDTTTHGNGVTSNLDDKAIKNTSAKKSLLLLSKPTAIKTEDVIASEEVVEPSERVPESNADSTMRRGQSAAPRQEADFTNSGRGRRARRTVSFLPEPDSESEDDWAEPDELDEDDLSASEGSDFEPSPKKNKKTPPNKKKSTVTNTLENIKNATKRSKTTLNHSNSPGVSSAPTSPYSAAVTAPLSFAKKTITPTVSTCKTNKLVSLCNKASAYSTPSLVILPDKPASVLSGAGQATSFPPCAAPTLSKSSSTLVPARAGLARAAFKCPVMNSGASGVSQADGARAQTSSLPSGTLRLGLSRKATFKPLHPNATVK